MYAVVTTDGITDREVTDQMLTEQLIPMVKQAPTFVRGFWVGFDGDRGISVVVF